MPKRNFFTVGLAAAWSFAILVSVASASPAMVETDAKVRSGPGTQYRALAVVQGGSTVVLLGRSGRWCAVDYGPHQGYVACSLLGAGERIGVVRPPMASFGSNYAGADYRPQLYAAWPAPNYPYYRDYYFRPGISFNVGVGF
jgi:uncharacterized protein YraI